MHEIMLQIDICNKKKIPNSKKIEEERRSFAGSSMPEIDFAMVCGGVMLT